MKAIETVYNGYRFRSRLEARWAVFFDTLGIKYEYEPEGFEFDDGTRYLPDFWLPGIGVYVEIKPPDIPEEVNQLMDKFRWQVGAIVLCGGNPWDNNNTGDVTLFCHDATDGSSGSFESRCSFKYSRYPYISVWEGWRGSGRTLFADWGMTTVLHYCILSNPDHDYVVEHAATAAKQARFEHGECP